jgi:hypothetical protein
MAPTEHDPLDDTEAPSPSPTNTPHADPWYSNLFKAKERQRELERLNGGDEKGEQTAADAVAALMGDGEEVVLEEKDEERENNGGKIELEDQDLDAILLGQASSTLNDKTTLSSVE